MGGALNVSMSTPASERPAMNPVVGSDCVRSTWNERAIGIAISGLLGIRGLRELCAGICESGPATFTSEDLGPLLFEKLAMTLPSVRTWMPHPRLETDAP